MLKLLRNVNKLLIASNSTKYYFGSRGGFKRLAVLNSGFFVKHIYGAKIWNTRLPKLFVLTSSVGIVLALCDSRFRYEEKRFFRAAQYGLMQEVKK